MSTYCENGKKKSSATAKTALGLAIGGLSLACVNSGLFGGAGGGDCAGGSGGLFGLFGNRGPSPYCAEEKRLGEQARNEVAMLDKYLFPMMARDCALEKEAAVNPLLMEREMVDKWILPLMHRTCGIEKELAVNEAKDAKDAVIQGLLFKLNEQNTDGKFELLKARTDAEFALGRALTDAEISKATCNVVRGKPYISPCQMADPYQAGANVLMARHVNTLASTQTTDCGCGCSGAWSGLV